MQKKKKAPRNFSLLTQEFEHEKNRSRDPKKRRQHSVQASCLNAKAIGFLREILSRGERHQKKCRGDYDIVV